MAYKIIIWNTQHFNNQSGEPSEAFTQKETLLLKLAMAHEPHLIALLEVGTTGQPNVSAEKSMEGLGYKLVHALTNEGGARADTTLGSMVFVRQEISDDFVLLGSYVLGENERRAPIVVVHKDTREALAFYHANASYNAADNTNEAIRFIVDNRHDAFEELVFFGGDLNSVPVYNASIQPSRHPAFTSVLPPTEGTHVSVMNKTRSEARVVYQTQVTSEYGPLGMPFKDWYPDYKMSEGLDDEFVIMRRMLDYAWVTQRYQWTAICDGLVKPLARFGGSYAGFTKHYLGEPVRSDHFPVFYVGKGRDEVLTFKLVIHESLTGFDIQEADRTLLKQAGVSLEIQFGSYKENPTVTNEKLTVSLIPWASGQELQVRSKTNLTNRFSYGKSIKTAWPARLVIPRGGLQSPLYLHLSDLKYA